MSSKNAMIPKLFKVAAATAKAPLSRAKGVGLRPLSQRSMKMF